MVEFFLHRRVVIAPICEPIWPKVNFFDYFARTPYRITLYRKLRRRNWKVGHETKSSAMFNAAFWNIRSTLKGTHFAAYSILIKRCCHRTIQPAYQNTINLSQAPIYLPLDYIDFYTLKYHKLILTSFWLHWNSIRIHVRSHHINLQIAN